MCWKRWYDCVSCAFHGFFEDEKESEIKGRSRFCARPAHKAPQCGAFHEFKTAVGFSLLRTVPQSVLKKVPVCQAFTAFLTAPAERK